MGEEGEREGSGRVGRGWERRGEQKGWGEK